VLGNAHFGKAQTRDPLALMMGSVAFANVARSVMGFAEDGEDDEVVISQLKNNLGRLDLPSLKYRIDSVTLDTEEGPAEVGRLVMLGESDRSVHDILRDRDDEDGDEVVQWLIGQLLQGPVKAVDIYAASCAADYSKDRAKRAKKMIGAIATHPEINGPWYWGYPKGAQGSKERTPAP
jgi:hypothetical protein